MADRRPGTITLFLGGDVMTGRGIDQVLPHPVDPRIHEPYVKSAMEYVELAERANGPIPRPVDFAYVWGDALEVLDRARPDARIVNLETSVTTSDDYFPKGINYRMNPRNVPCLNAAGIDCCGLANNHVLDWGPGGLAETLETLAEAGIETAGAGGAVERAQAPAILEVAGKGRVIVFSFGASSSGIPRQWAAREDRPGVDLLDDLSPTTVAAIGQRVRAVKRPGDIVVASIHWGGNWGYPIPRDHVRFGHGLVEEAGIDVVHGHSSHHALGIEIHRGKPILYGCGDLLNDYEGIGGQEEFRDDLPLIYLPSFEVSSGELAGFQAVPLRIANFRLNRASRDEARWLRDVLAREGERFGTRVELNPDDTLTLAKG